MKVKFVWICFAFLFSLFLEASALAHPFSTKLGDREEVTNTDVQKIDKKPGRNKNGSSEINLAVDAVIVKAVPSIQPSHSAHHRVRRSFSYKMQCIPTTTKKCKIFTVSGMTKPFCAYVVKKHCFALD